MTKIGSGNWQPIGVEQLEPAALAAVKSMESCVVIAGPGAGKTELLAQRAAFLFQTGTCPDPQRILSISFKRDAAHNLAERVARRCSPEQSRRLSSVTFDGFTKSIFDRFANALPKLWRPVNGYEIGHASEGDIKRFIKEAERGISSQAWREDVDALIPKSFESEHLGAWRLPADRRQPENGIEFLIIALWMKYLQASPSKLTFTMINRLAELVQRMNPPIGRAIRRSFPFVFVDECQDTTYAQYDFLRSIFAEGSTVITAVGDEKQGIMGWAGAHKDIMARIEADFGARVVPLRCNYRSSPELVRMQHVFARELDSTSIVVESRAIVSGGATEMPAQIWNFASEVDEAVRISRWIRKDMDVSGLNHRDYGLLVRQGADSVETTLAQGFALSDLEIRNEARKVARSTVQEVLTEPLTAIVLGFLRLATRERDPVSWMIVEKAMILQRGINVDDESAERLILRLDNDIMSFVGDISELLRISDVTSGVCGLLVGLILDFVDAEGLGEVYPEYRKRDSLYKAIEAIEALLGESTASAADWEDVFDRFEGLGRIPLMTIHKSKGLEFDSVFCLGLDDKSWWNYSPGNKEELATFFVGLSRAKRRVFFTYCLGRGTKSGVAELYEWLHRAGVREFDLSGPGGQ